MSSWFVLVSVVAAVNPARVAARLAATPAGIRRRLVAIGSIAGLAGVLTLGLGAEWLLEALEISNETWRIAAGIIGLLAGARCLVFGAGSQVPEVGAPIHALVPVAFPVLLVPELVVLAILYGTTEPMSLQLAAPVVAFVIVIVWSGAANGPGNRGMLRLTGAVMIAIGVALIVAGIRDV